MAIRSVVKRPSAARRRREPPAIGVIAHAASGWSVPREQVGVSDGVLVAGMDDDPIDPRSAAKRSLGGTPYGVRSARSKN
jgi:hypothetical protein